MIEFVPILGVNILAPILYIGILIPKVQLLYNIKVRECYRGELNSQEGQWAFKDP